jgi:murein DD-endopeptidase MepM/ murein hydrolase activator NlpD
MKALISICLICLPLKHLTINSGYGYRVHPLTGRYAMHFGIDLKARQDTVFAVLDGFVKSISYDSGLGIHIRLNHGDVETVYGHLSQLLVMPQDSVSAGEPIGITGATGRVTGEHLHFCICYKHKYINPIKFLYELLNKNDHERTEFQKASDPAVK